MADEKRSPDEWARAKGLVSDNPKEPAKDQHLYAGCRHQQHWVAGDLITEKDFEAKMDAFRGLPVGAPLGVLPPAPGDLCAAEQVGEHQVIRPQGER